MAIFQKTADEQRRIDDFRSRLEQTIEALRPCGEQIDFSGLERLLDSFNAQIDDFYRSDRKLNIGVIGQVKAGKSTFLNTLLFDGSDVLPSARTPKTAVLTMIEYSENNCLEVDFYDREDWQLLEEYSLTDIADNEHEAAREIMKLASANGIDPYKYIGTGSAAVEFGSADELMGKLNDYVGENGKITPFVKNVTIRINKPELEEISVIDTPGLNDAIASRTDKTREFMEKCDVVFFLSRTSQFLDAVDMKLVSRQLPQKGVENLILIGSQFDGGILDELKKTRSLSVSAENIRQKQTEHAADIIRLDPNGRIAEIRFAEACRNPIFISSLMYNASKKDSSDYSRTEAFYVKKLNRFKELDDESARAEILRSIGNIDTVKEKFGRIIARKDATLQDKASHIVPNAKKEYAAVLQEMTRSTRSTLTLLQTSDKESIIKQRKLIQSQISEIKLSLENVLGELLIALESCKNDCMRKLRDNARDNSRVEERQGTEWHTGSHMVGQHKFLCFKWGGHREYYNYSTTYTYLAASDALENVRNFSYDACSDIEDSFVRAIDIRSTKKRLVNTILQNFDTSDESFDINSFRHVVERTMNQLEFPTFKLDASSYLDSISSKFSGEIKDSKGRTDLQKTLADVMDGLFNDVSARFTSEVASFRGKIEAMKSNFESTLLKNINDEYDKLQAQFEDKENEIEKYAQALKLLQEI